MPPRHGRGGTVKPRKGNPDFESRRLFSDDNLLYFARALKIYAEMGWPMDYQAIQLMFSEAARDMKLVDWRKGDAPVVSISYVRAFVKNAPELHSYKTSHIDPLRAKKATTKVRAMGTGMARGVAAAPPLQHPAHYLYKPI